MSAAVAFVDPMAPRAYSGAPGALDRLGGTEATLVRICEALAPDLPLTLYQTARRSPARINGLAYAGYDVKRPLPGDPATIVVVNSWKVALKLARLHPEARLLVWQHVFPGRHNRALAPALVEAGVELLCVSQSHADWLRGFLGPHAPRLHHIHNPIADDLWPDDTRRNPNLLLFASSPHKGLAQVFQRFAALRQRLPALKLAVADPGYLAWQTGAAPAGVIALGRLSQPALIGWMRRSLCLFYPQDHFAETFGLVIAEANAVGCPALLHSGLGANDEVASDPGQCLDTRDPEAIAARIAEWRARANHAPLARPRPEFRQSRILRDWSALLQPRGSRIPQPDLSTWAPTLEPLSA